MKVRDCSLEVNKFEFQSRYQINFWTNILGKGKNPPCYGLNTITAVLLQE